MAPKKMTRGVANKTNQEVVPSGVNVSETQSVRVEESSGNSATLPEPQGSGSVDVLTELVSDPSLSPASEFSEAEEEDVARVPREKSVEPESRGVPSSTSDEEPPTWAKLWMAHTAEQQRKAEERHRVTLEEMTKAMIQNQEANSRPKIPKTPPYSVQKLKKDATLGEVEDWLSGLQEVNQTLAPNQPDRFYVMWASNQMTQAMSKTWRSHKVAKGLEDPTFEELKSFLRKEHAGPGQRKKETVANLLSLKPVENEDPLEFMNEYQNLLFRIEERRRPGECFEATRIVNLFPNWLQREYMRQDVVEFEKVEDVCYKMSKFWRAGYKEPKKSEPIKERRETKKAGKKAVEPAAGPKCYACGKMGHISRGCPSSKSLVKRKGPEGGKAHEYESRKPKVQKTGQFKPAEYSSSVEGSGKE